MITALRTFSLDKLNYWRERASGMSSFAYFLAKDTVDHLNTVVKPVVYLSMFYFFNNPRSSFGDNYVVLLCLIYCVTGIGYILTIPLNPGAAQLVNIYGFIHLKRDNITHVNFIVTVNSIFLWLAVVYAPSCCSDSCIHQI